jgi:transposase
MKQSILYVGLDVHASSINAATAEAGRAGEIRSHGRIAPDLHAVDLFLARLGHPGRELRVCYEAGPCGFALARHLREKGIACAVIAPSKTPKGRGDKIKTDRRDAQMLARLHRAGELTAIHVPDPDDEAVRDLCRARTDAVEAMRRARCQLKAFLLRNGHHALAREAWGPRTAATLRKPGLRHPAMGVVLEEYLETIESALARTARLEKAMEDQCARWSQTPVVRALMGLRGFRLVSAMITVSELGDIHRFAHPRQLMAYAGLVPGESSSGDTRRLGAITKSGNAHLRWLLNESAQHYRLPPEISVDLARRQEDIPAAHRAKVREISWKCQQRLYQKSRKLTGRLKMRQKIQIALARELCGFVWAVMKTTQPSPPQPASRD